MSPEEAASKCTQLIFAHEFERALALFHDFAHELYFVQNAFDSSCAILKAVVEGIDTRSRPGWLAWTMDALGSFTGRLGRPAKAVEHYSEAVALSRNVNCPSKHLAMVLGNRFLELLRLGELARARADQDERIAILTELARDDFDAAFQLATAYLGSAYLRIMTADFDLAKTECDLAQQWFARSGRGDISFVPIARTILALELNANEPSLEHVENAERYAHEANRHSGAETGRDRIRALWALGVTLATKASLTGDAQVAMKARSLLRQALLECQCIDLKELEPDILIALALVERRIDLAREAQAITETCGYRLKNIDARLAQARLLVHANLEQANAAAASAASLAGPCGYQRGIFAAQRVQREIVHKTNRG